MQKLESNNIFYKNKLIKYFFLFFLLVTFIFSLVFLIKDDQWNLDLFNVLSYVSIGCSILYVFIILINKKILIFIHLFFLLVGLAGLLCVVYRENLSIAWYQVISFTSFLFITSFIFFTQLIYYHKKALPIVIFVMFLIILCIGITLIVWAWFRKDEKINKTYDATCFTSMVYLIACISGMSIYYQIKNEKFFLYNGWQTIISIVILLMFWFIFIAVNYNFNNDYIQLWQIILLTIAIILEITFSILYTISFIKKKINF